MESGSSANRTRTFSFAAKAGVAAAALALGVLITFAVSTYNHLALPAPTGSFPVGKMRLAWVDPSRREQMAASPSAHREIVAFIWYPAVARTGGKASYINDLGTLAGPLVASKELSRAAVIRLGLVRVHARSQATPTTQGKPFPVILLSPGQGAKAEFYSAFAEDLASHGYVVIGLDHPYDVAAVVLANGSVAAMGSGEQGSQGPYLLATRIAERQADVSFVLDRLAELNSASGALPGELDLERIGIMGHSVGGITAAEACRSDPRLKACLNIDGDVGNGPFSVSSTAPRPAQPFLYLTKDHLVFPGDAARFEAPGGPSYRVVVNGATHVEFEDLPLFAISLNPFARNADRVISAARTVTRAFFDHYLKNSSGPALADFPVPIGVHVYAYVPAPK